MIRLRHRCLQVVLVYRRQVNIMDNKVKRSAYDIEALMREYGNDVLRTAYSYVNDRAAAEDCFQEVFIKAYKNLSGFRGESSVKTWLIRITINVCKDYLKSAYQRHLQAVTARYCGVFLSA